MIFTDEFIKEIYSENIMLDYIERTTPLLGYGYVIEIPHFKEFTVDDYD